MMLNNIVGNAKILYTTTNQLNSFQLHIIYIGITFYRVN